MNKQSATAALKTLTRFAAVCERIDSVVDTYSAVGIANTWTSIYEADWEFAFCCRVHTASTPPPQSKKGAMPRPDRPLAEVGAHL